MVKSTKLRILLKTYILSSVGAERQVPVLATIVVDDVADDSVVVPYESIERLPAARGGYRDFVNDVGNAGSVLWLVVAVCTGLAAVGVSIEAGGW